MVDKVSDKKQKKSFVSEANMSSVLQRYSPNTVLALLQEVAQLPVEKYNWKSLVKKTSTGITNAREYQMLWRHLAYSHGLLDKLEEGAEPLDDDSDLEHELQAFPDASSEASAEAAACVKVLIASGSASDSSLPNNATVEAPLIINIPNGQSFRPSSDDSEAACSMQGTNITVPVSVQKLPLPTSTSAEGLDGNGSIGGNMPPRKRRKQWTPEEDIELIAAVQKCGEGNWANILRGDFKWDRTASQLSQRWSVLRKKHGYLVPGISSSGTQLSEAQLAARHAMSLALDMPVKNIAASSANNNGTAAATSSTTTGISLPATASTDSSPGGSSSAQAQPLQGSAGTKPAPLVLPGPTAKSRAPPKKAPAKPNFSPDSSLRAAAVAAGARIMTPSDAASLLKGTQGKSAIHIMPSGGSSVKPSVSYIQTGVSSAPLSSSSAVTSIAPPSSVKPPLQRVQQNSNVSSTEQTNAVLSSNPEVKAKEEMKVSGSCSVLGSESSKEVHTDNKGCAMLKPQVEVKKEAAFENRSSLDTEMGEGNQIGNDNTKIVNANPIRNEGTKMTDANQTGKDDKKMTDANHSGNDDKKMTHANQTANDDKKMTGATQSVNDDRKMTDANQTGNDDKKMIDANQTGNDDKNMTDANQTVNDDKKMTDANQTVNDDKKMKDANQTGNDDTKMTDAEVEEGSKKQSATKANCEPQSSNDKKSQNGGQR